MNLPTSSTAGEPKPARLLDRLLVMMGQRNIASFQVEEAVRWVEAFIRFHGRRHPRELGTEHIAGFVKEKGPGTVYSRLWDATDDFVRY